MNGGGPKFYAESGRKLWQVLADALALLAAYFVIKAALALKDRALIARDGANQLESGAKSLRDNFKQASDALSHLPFGVGGPASSPFKSAATQADNMAASGRNLADGLERTANMLALVVGITPIILILIVWGLTRGRYIAQATRVAKLRDLAGGRRLLALEALTMSTSTALLALDDDPAGAWADGDEEVVNKLANVRLRQLGLRTVE